MNITGDIKNFNTLQTPLGVTNPVKFKSNLSKQVEKTSETDVVEIQGKKKKKKGLVKKIALGVGGAFGTLIVVLTLLSKARVSSLKKLYNEKMVLRNLPEKLDFKDAKSLDEAVKYAKEILGVKNINGFDKYSEKEALEALNWTNKALVDVSNAHKGKVFIPQNIYYAKRDGSAIAAVTQDIESKRFGDLMINSEYFNHEALNKRLMERLSSSSKPISSGNSKKDLFQSVVDKKTYDLQNRFLKDKNSITLREKITLLETCRACDHDYFNVYDDILGYLRKNEKMFSDNGIKINFEEFEKLSKEAQKDKFLDIVAKYVVKKGKPIQIRTEAVLPEATIYHEMGHLQDFAKNQQVLDLKDWDFNIIKLFKDTWKEVEEAQKSGKKFFLEVFVVHLVGIYMAKWFQLKLVDMGLVFLKYWCKIWKAKMFL